MSDNHTIQKRVSIHTFGCRLNQYESDGLLQKFSDSHEYKVVNENENPDLLIINSCTVTNQADNKSLSFIRKFKKNNPDSKIIFTGCFAQTDSSFLNKNQDIDLVIGNDHKTSLFSIVEENSKNVSTLGNSDLSFDSNLPRNKTNPSIDSKLNKKKPVLFNPFSYGLVLPQGHIRAYLKIQDGCDRKCSYCKIPQARGLGVSREPGEIMEHVQELDRLKVPEIVITGVNLGWYKQVYKNTSLNFPDLVELILNHLKHSRLRLSSIEPCDIDEQIAQLTLHKKMCSFLHIPLQSGSRKILKKMRRTYNKESFLKRVKNVRRINPEIFIGTDVIVGFPGETEHDFQESLDVCKQANIANIHGFRFSKRDGTPAAGFENQVSQTTMKSRMKKLMLQSTHQHILYVQKFKNQTRQAVLEKISTASTPLEKQAFKKQAYGELLTDNFIRVRIPFPETKGLKRGDVVNIKMNELIGGTKIVSANVI